METGQGKLSCPCPPRYHGQLTADFHLNQSPEVPKGTFRIVSGRQGLGHARTLARRRCKKQMQHPPSLLMLHLFFLISS